MIKRRIAVANHGHNRKPADGAAEGGGACIATNRVPCGLANGNALAAMESPCILVCSIDDKTGYCFGCGRRGIPIRQSTWDTLCGNASPAAFSGTVRRFSVVPVVRHRYAPLDHCSG